MYRKSKNLYTLMQGSIGQSSGVSGCSLSVDGRYLVSGSDDQSLRSWNLSTGECPREFIGHSGWVSSCIMSANSRYLISTAADSSLRIWSMETGEPIKIIFNAPNSNYLTVDGTQTKILAKSEYAWRYFNGYYINNQAEPDSFPVI